MRQTRAFILASLLPLGFNALVAEAQTAVVLRITEIGTCLIGKLDVPCSDVGEKLREMRIPHDAPIQLSVAPHASFYAVSAALEGLRHTGLKLGYTNVQAQ